MLAEFRVPCPTVPFVKLLHVYYKCFPCDHQGSSERVPIFCTLLALLWKRDIMDNPQHFFLHCLNVTNESDCVRLRDVLSLLQLGEVSEDHAMASNENFVKLATRHGVGNNIQPRTRITLETLQLILDLSPALMLDFRDTITQHFDFNDRLNALSVKEVHLLYIFFEFHFLHTLHASTFVGHIHGIVYPNNQPCHQNQICSSVEKITH
jgi:hypothetical protein